MYAPRFFVSSQQRFGVTDIKALCASWTNSVIALRQLSATALFYLEDSGRIHPRRREESGGGRQGWGGGGWRERQRDRDRERQRERTLLLLFLCFFSSPWACPMQIGLGQERYSNYLTPLSQKEKKIDFLSTCTERLLWCTLGPNPTKSLDNSPPALAPCLGPRSPGNEDLPARHRHQLPPAKPHGEGRRARGRNHSFSSGH